MIPIKIILLNIIKINAQAFIPVSLYDWFFIMISIFSVFSIISLFPFEGDGIIILLSKPE